jgi:hypothetical protein
MIQVFCFRVAGQLLLAWQRRADVVLRSCASVDKYRGTVG